MMCGTSCVVSCREYTVSARARQPAFVYFSEVLELGECIASDSVNKERKYLNICIQKAEQLFHVSIYMFTCLVVCICMSSIVVSERPAIHLLNPPIMAASST